jgi:serine/threonine-protein kinase HipA
MKELSVIYRGWGAETIVGTLAEHNRFVLFQYSPEVLNAGLALSPLKLPLEVSAYPRAPAEYHHLQGVPGLIYDSLPDAWGYRVMHRRMRSKGIDPVIATTLDRLAYLGSNTMGALTYQPATGDRNDEPGLALLALASEVEAVVQDEDHEVLSALARAGASPGGARPKALVFYDPDSGEMCTAEGHVRNGEPWLVKFAGNDDAKDSCAVEELYARLAGKAQLGMEPTRFYSLPDGRSAFATRRFDRKGATRIHVHSLAGLLHADFTQPSVGYAEFLRATFFLSRDMREVVKALQRCVFNVIVNNRDDHAKNLSFRLMEGNRWELAPPYDLTYCPGYRGEHFMDVWGEGKTPTRADIINVGKSAGMKAADAAQVIDELLDRLTVASVDDAAVGLPVRRNSIKTIKDALKVNRSALV